MWTVKWFFNNPARNYSETYTNRRDAATAARSMSSDDPDDTQCVYIESDKSPVWGRRTLGKPHITWHTGA